jgi:hypothetical protein
VADWTTKFVPGAGQDKTSEFPLRAIFNVYGMCHIAMLVEGLPAASLKSPATNISLPLQAKALGAP